MGKIFISYVTEDERFAVEAAELLEQLGFSTWYYQRDSIPGPSYLEQVSEAIEDQCAVILVLISERSLKSNQVTKEIVHAHEANRPFVPVLIDLDHETFQRRKPEWRQAMGAHASVRMPLGGMATIISRIVSGLIRLGVHPLHETDVAERDRISPAPGALLTSQHSSPWRSVGDFDVRLEALFDEQAYAMNDDSEARMLIEVEVKDRNPPQQARVAADILLVLDVSGSMKKENRYELLEAAVTEFIERMEPSHRVAIIVFSTETERISSFLPGPEARQMAPYLLGGIRRSPAFFGRKTNLAPAIGEVNGILRSQARPNAVKRIYVLTDGRVHDGPSCFQQLQEVPQHKAEIGIYGFGGQLDADYLKRLLVGQYGGWVKPIVNLPEIVSQFGHIAEVNRSLIAEEARLVIDFPENITCGHAWAFRPQERHFGQIKKRRNVCDLGPLEANRVYALLFEVRLPIHPERHTPVANCKLVWRLGSQTRQCQSTICVERDDRVLLDDVTVNTYGRAGQAYVVLDALRRKVDDDATQLAVARAQLLIARYEGRSPDLIRVIEQKIARLEMNHGRDVQLAPEDQFLEEADWSSGISLTDSMVQLEVELDSSEDDPNSPR